MGVRVANGNGHSVAILDRPVLSGRSLALRHLDARQRACIAAGWILGELTVKPSLKMATAAADVSAGYVKQALDLSAAKREAIREGRDPTSFRALRRPALPPPPVNWSVLDKEALREVVRAVGVERLVELTAEEINARNAA